MRFQVRHSTEYAYESPVNFALNMATIRPRECPGQKVLDHKLTIDPEPSEISHRLDFFGNYMTRFSIQKAHHKLVVNTQSTIERDFTAIQESYFSDRCTQVTLSTALEALHQMDAETLDARQFVLESIFISPIGQIFRNYAEESFAPNRSVFEATKELMQRIYTDFEFVPGFTNVSTPVKEVMKNRKGVCQDFAQVAIACVRSMGLPARYVSGYIETLPPPGKEKLVGADASHAWFSVYVPTFGWVDMDPTNNQIPNDQHIVVGWGRDYYDVPPLKGVVYGGGKSTLKVAVDIVRMS